MNADVPQECVDNNTESQEYNDDDARVEKTLEDLHEVIRPSEDEIVDARQKLVKKYENRIKGYKYRPYSTRRRRRKEGTDAQSFAMMHMLQNVSLTQYNIKQGLKKFGQKELTLFKSS